MMCVVNVLCLFCGCLLCYVILSSLLLFFYFFFFVKQKTAYEMRISDWSSDVCSSDLVRPGGHQGLSGLSHRSRQTDSPDRALELGIHQPGYRTTADRKSVV